MVHVISTQTLVSCPCSASDLVMVVCCVLNALDRHLVSGSDWYTCLHAVKFENGSLYIVQHFQSTQFTCVQLSPQTVLA